MTYATPLVLVSVSKNNKMKKEISGPREETLMLIRQFARLYEYNPGQRQKVRKYLTN
jgi:hypothetical protein